MEELNYLGEDPQLIIVTRAQNRLLRRSFSLTNAETTRMSPEVQQLPTLKQWSSYERSTGN